MMDTERNTPGAASDSGISLIELVVVMAVFALVAVMSLQAMSATLRLRDRLAGIETRSAEVSRALTLLRADLDAAAPLLFYAPDGEARSAFMAPVTASGQTRDLRISVAAQPVFPGSDGVQFARLHWWFDPAAQTLNRQRWPLLSPLEAQSQEPATELLSDVTGFEIRSHSRGFAPGQGWEQGDGQAADSLQTTLPAAIELLISTADQGPLRLLVSLQ